MATPLYCFRLAATASLAIAATASPAQPTVQVDLPGTFDPDNMIARIVRGEIPVAKLYENDHVLAFLGDRPFARGHFLVVSKTSKARNFLDIPGEDLARIMDVARRVAAAEIEVLGAQGFTLRQNSGSASHLQQFHLHVIPRWAGDKLPETAGAPTSRTELETIADQIRARVQTPSLRG